MGEREAEAEAEKEAEVLQGPLLSAPPLPFPLLERTLSLSPTDKSINSTELVCKAHPAARPKAAVACSPAPAQTACCQQDTLDGSASGRVRGRGTRRPNSS